MRESQYIRGWMNEGVKEGTLKTMQANLLMVIRQLENPVSESIRKAIEDTDDLDTLQRWFEAALDVLWKRQRIDNLRKFMNLDS